MFSVILPTYNGGIYLKEAVNSILNQDFPDFELLVIDDGSTDNSLQFLSSISDQRIRLVRNVVNKGLIYSLNKGLDICKGEFIARMDADDIAKPFRLSMQLKVFKENPAIGVCGGNVEYIDEKANLLKMQQNPLPLDSKKIKTLLFFKNPIIHSTVCIRRSILKERSLSYNSDYILAEDYKLWLDLSTFTEFLNLPEIILSYRFHQNNVSNNPKQSAIAAQIKCEAIEGILGMNLSKEEIEMFRSVLLPWEYSSSFRSGRIIELVNKILFSAKEKELCMEIFEKRLGSLVNKFISTLGISFRDLILFKTSLKVDYQYSYTRGLVVYYKKSLMRLLVIKNWCFTLITIIRLLQSS